MTKTSTQLQRVSKWVQDGGVGMGEEGGEHVCFTHFGGLKLC